MKMQEKEIKEYNIKLIELTKQGIDIHSKEFKAGVEWGTNVERLRSKINFKNLMYKDKYEDTQDMISDVYLSGVH